VSPSRSGGNREVFARLVSTALRIKFYLASTRSAVSQDNVWEPRVILIPCWYAVSVTYTAVENHSSSRYMGLEHWSSWLSEKRELWFCGSFFFFRNSFSNICLESTKTSKRLLFITSSCLTRNLSWYASALLTVLGILLSLSNLKFGNVLTLPCQELRECHRIHHSPLITMGRENRKHCLAGMANTNYRRRMQDHLMNTNSLKRTGS